MHSLFLESEDQNTSWMHSLFLFKKAHISFAGNKELDSLRNADLIPARNMKNLKIQPSNQTLKPGGGNLEVLLTI
jgi:hypothetical protein